MIWLTEEDRNLLKEMEREISKENMMENWEHFMEFTPIHSGSLEEEAAVQFLKEKLIEYGLDPEILRFDAYISDPKWAKLEILSPLEMEINCTPYRQVGTTDPNGIEGEVVYILPQDLGKIPCKDKIILADQKTTDDWMGLRNGLLLKLQGMGVKGIIVIEQDSYKPDVVHQRADFSVSGNPTSDNIDLVQTIPAIIHLTYKDGASLKELVKRGGVRAKVTSIVETHWKPLPLLVAEIKGNLETERFLLVNGHVDTPPFSPGVVDNASGDVAMLELARILAKYKEGLRRSIRFAFWPGHEIGRYAGSTWYNDAFWHDLRYYCIGSYNIDSPGSKGANTFRAIPISEVKEAVEESIKAVIGINIQNLRWPTRAGDGSFWGTGIPHVSLTSSRPEELYDPHVNYSGGGWWWHTTQATMEHGDVEVMEMDVRAELNYIFMMINCPILPMNFTTYAEHCQKILEDLQEKGEEISEHFNLYPVIQQVKEFRSLSVKLDDAIKISSKTDPRLVDSFNHCLMWVSRYINPVAHSNAGPTEQVSMETFGATPFPRIKEITVLAKMDPRSDQFKLLKTKLMRQRNLIEDAFFQANKLIKRTIKEANT
jgi:hypothetical protein